MAEHLYSNIDEATKNIHIYVGIFELQKMKGAVEKVNKLY